MKSIFIVTSFFFSFQSFAKIEEDGHCTAQLKILDFKALNIQDCNFAKKLVDNDDVKAYHREKVYEKFAEKIAKNVEQNFEEIALLEQFYSENNQELMMGSTAIKDQCKISQFTKMENKCGGKKLELLKAQYKSGGSTLYQKFSSKFIMTRNLGVVDVKQCPISGASGAFTLDSQLDSSSVLNFIKNLKTEKIGNDENSKGRIDSLFSQYPLFKLVTKTNDQAFIEKFKSYAKTFAGPPENAKKYISEFFFNPENQKLLSGGLAEQCKVISKNIDTFLCNDLTQLASTNPTASLGMFELNPEYTNFQETSGLKDDKAYMAFGFKCLADDPKERELLAKSRDTVDNWYKAFTENMRPEINKGKATEKSDDFCEFYLCKEESVQGKNSCKNGGPLSSYDLIEAFKCPGKDCTEEIRKYITFMKTFENENEKNKKFASTIKNFNSTTERPHKNSLFIENFLGVEGSLIADGKAITSKSIAEKTTDFVERKLDPTPATAEAKKLTPPPQVASATALIRPPVEQQAIQTQTRSSASQDSTNDTNDDTPALGARKAKQPRAKSSYEDKPSTDIASASSNKDKAEMDRMRNEIDSLRDSMKNDQKSSPSPSSPDSTSFATSASPSSKGSSRVDAFRSGDKLRNDQQLDAGNASRPAGWQAPSDTVASAESKPQASASDAASAKKSESEGGAKGKKDSLLSQGGADKNKAQKDGAANGGTVPGDAPTTEVASDDLVNLELGTLKKLGINSKSIFHIKIHDKQNKKVYDVVVRPDAVKGYLVPVLDDKNKPVSKLILASPLFKEYVESAEFKKL